MKKKLLPFLFVLPIALGIVGAYARAVALAHDARGSALLTSLSIAAVIIFAAAAVFLRKERRGLGGGEKEGKIAFTVAGFIMLVAAFVALFEVYRQYELLKLVFALLTIYCSVSLIVLGKYSLAAKDSIAYCTMSAVPVFWACFLLIITFRERISNPIIYEYVFLMFAYICILLFAYALAGEVLGKNRVAFGVFAALSGTYFIITEALAPYIAKVISGGLYEAVLFSPELLFKIAFLILMPFGAYLMAGKEQKK